MCKEKEVCRICAAKGHMMYDCLIKRRNDDNGDTKDQFSSLLDNAMQDDSQYLYALQHISSHAISMHHQRCLWYSTLR